jgi:hypothetical protein
MVGVGVTTPASIGSNQAAQESTGDSAASMGQIPRLVMAEKLGRRERSDQAEKFRSCNPTAAIGDSLPMKIQAVIFAIASLP